MGIPAFAAGIHFQWIKNSKGKQFRLCGKIDCDQMEHLEGKRYSQYTMEGNPSAYMSMRDYINQSWQSQQPVERNPSKYRSMRDYRDQWMSSPYGSTYNHRGNHTNSSWEPKHPQYAPFEPLYYAPISQQQQPPTPSPVEQAIPNLSKIVDNFIEEQRVVTVQANQETETVESSLDKKLDGFQSKIDQKLDILQESISKLTNQLVHQEEENPEEECQSETMVEEPCLQQLQVGLVENFEPSDIGAAVCPWEKKEETSPMLIEEGSGKEKIEKPQKSTAQAINSPLPEALSLDQVYTLPAAQPIPKAPTIKATHHCLC